MRIVLCVSFILILYGAPASAADPDPSPSQPTAMSRMTAIATKVFTTVTNLVQDVLPLVKAADEEIAREWRSEWPHIEQEIRQQLGQALSEPQPKADSQP